MVEMLRNFRSLFLAIAAIIVIAPTVSHGGEPVDLALVLAVDCSYSVDAGEFDQQMKGLVSAFQNPDVAAAIASVPGGRIAVSLVQWSGPTSQVLAVDWKVLASPKDASAFAAMIAATPRLSREGATSISAMVEAGISHLLHFPGTTRRRVIDISSDGINNTGGSLARARDQAQALGITVNALAILNEFPSLDRYFELHLIVGPSAFVEPADDYSDYGRAILRKLLREIGSPNV